METDGKVGLWEGMMRRRSHQNSLKALLSRPPKNSTTTNHANQNDDTLNLPHLSPLAISVVSRCSRILKIPTEELQYQFGRAIPENTNELLTYARNFLEFCSYQALTIVSRNPSYLSDKEFHRLTFDMMLAWEAPSVDNKQLEKVENEKTVGPEAFARIAPTCAAVADIITVYNLFDALTTSSGYRLHFLVYEKYIRSLDKIIKAAKSALVPSIGNLKLAEGEIVLDVDGAVPTQPVLQHIAISTRPGRLTLTNYALYFESFGVKLYDNTVRYDLETDMKQVIKPELTGPWGARLFDSAVMYKSTSIADPVSLEFPEFKGSARRDYWLDICLEVLYAHRFIRKNNLKEIQKSEVLSRAVLGIFRYRAVREAFRFSASHYKSLLPFSLAESLPRGDFILDTLSSQLVLLNADAARGDVSGNPYAKRQSKLFPVSLLALCKLGFILEKGVNLEEKAIVVGDVCVGETSPLELAVKQSLSDTSSTEAAQATIDRVKVEGINTNVAVLKELLFPAIELVRCLQTLASWKDPFKSTIFLMLTCYAILRGWSIYIFPSLLLFTAVLMLWRRHFNNGKPLEPLRVTPAPTRSAVEQLLTFQVAISEVEALIQAGNIILLKIRVILFAVLPEATERAALLLVYLAAVFLFVPLRYIMMLVFLDVFTRRMPYRKESSGKLVRRVREW